MGYWQDRNAKMQAALTLKNEKQIQQQIRKYYASAAKSVISDFENTYAHLLASIEKGRQPTPADLYKLQKYWEMTGNLQKSLNNLGDIEIEVLTQLFKANYLDIYNGLDLPTDAMFNSLSDEVVNQMINSVWCADGKTWSTRIWDSKGKLADILNEELINTLLTGKKTTDLKNKLQEHFNSTYYEANRLVKTELAHIQTVAAQQRYKDAGLNEFQVWADKDERRCEICGKLHKKKYKINEAAPIPAHPNCRCCIVPVIENNSQLIIKDDKIKMVEEKEKVQNNKNLTNSKKDSKIIAPEWKNANFRDEKAKEKHKKHLQEYGNITFEEYVEGARELLSKEIDDNIDGFINNAGAIYRYDKENNDFVIGKDGIIFTRFKPKEGIKYWEMKKNEELNQL